MDIYQRALKLTKTQIEILERLGLTDTDEVLQYYPFRYEYLDSKPFSLWQEKDKITFEAQVVKTATSFRKGRLTTSHFEVMAYDHIFKCTIFNRPWSKNLQVEQTITLTGIYQGNYRITVMNYDTKKLDEHSSITPIYSLKQNMRQTSIRNLVKKVFSCVENEIEDDIPEPFLRKYRLLHKLFALKKIHFPETHEDIIQATRTLKYEEFLKFFTTILLLKNEEYTEVDKIPKQIDHSKINQIIASLPYSLTIDQKKTLDTILEEMESVKMMYRLVQGDVGCGKTIVAILALYAAALSHEQSTLLAPTEILAKQHYQNACEILADTGVKIALLYSGLSVKEKAMIIEETKEGKIDILIGTHSLIQDEVIFQHLGLVIADEQQRFGVEQRKKLRLKGDKVDFLLMSATPIPRTLASSLYGDMDISTIETMPIGRKEPITRYIEENSFRTVDPMVKKILDKGHQVYVICAAVDKNEDYDARNVYETAKNIQIHFPAYKVGILHGRMSSEEKESAMQDFYANRIQILVSTTVVEVGMNVVNAIGMIIYDADRFGLSQLHQLRGRIQRGSEVGYCWLLSDSKDDKVKQRLNALVKSNNGFEIAYEDLRLRGPGDILGTRQSGLPDFILGNLVEDTKIINQARVDAEFILKHKTDERYQQFIDKLIVSNQKKNEYRN